MTAAEFLESRQYLGLSQPKLAEKLGVSLRSIQYYEGGHAIPQKVELAMHYLTYCQSQCDTRSTI